MKKILSIILISLVILAGLWIISQPQKSSQSNKGEGLEKVEIGYSRLRISLPIFVADQAGIFEKHGIDADLKMYETAQPLMQALVEGKVDVAGYTALPITYNGMLRSNKDLYFLSLMVEDQEHRISYFLRPSTPSGQSPSIVSISDLGGKTVGILPTIAYKSWLEAILSKNGLVPGKDVIIQQVAPTLQAQALKSGGVDALFTNDPAATSAIKIGVAEPFSDQVEVPAYLGSPFPFGSFNVSKTWAEENPDTMRKLSAALNEAIDFVNSNPELSKVYMAPYLPEQFQAHVSSYPDALYVKLSDSNEDILDTAMKQYFEIGIIPSMINLEGLVYKSND